ncbi:Npun_R2479 family HD domain-containing metalloprotein [Lusitaniella coriacea]|uniref:Npun_R2479 family HD domain-containing metalloprotein n=1 Tax=Lusitaniella coriacea TaxID=1983105 RepID=UPI001D155B5E|nr:Npun_R2479 family HD domain-containing metalloprotein [Lusitaniella coriacea]
MFHLRERTIETCGVTLQETYRQIYGNLHPEYADTINWAANMALENIANSDAPYHNLEHTTLVTLVGQEILRGKHLQEASVKSEDWLHSIISLLCHDIGYLKGICREDRPKERVYATGIAEETITLAPGTTDASLTPFHIDRGKRFVKKRFGNSPFINTDLLENNIELTRFPVPADRQHQSTTGYAALVRAADLIGQLADPHYLQKLPALFHEFEETGAHRSLGYCHSGELRADFPNFFWKVIPYIQPGLNYLSVTQRGQQILANLYANVFLVEHELLEAELPSLPKLPERDEFCPSTLWQETTPWMDDSNELLLSVY